MTKVGPHPVLPLRSWLYIGINLAIQHPLHSNSKLSCISEKLWFFPSVIMANHKDGCATLLCFWPDCSYLKKWSFINKHIETFICIPEVTNSRILPHYLVPLSDWPQIFVRNGSEMFSSPGGCVRNGMLIADFDIGLIQGELQLQSLSSRIFCKVS